MYYQLLNTSIIWLLSLVVFDLFLKKETFHRLKRFYLLLTFILGMTLPLLPWRQEVQLTVVDKAADSLAPNAPAVVSVTAQAIPATIQTSSNRLMHLDYSDWLVILYLAGTVVCTVLLLKENLHLYLLYRRGNKTRAGKWVIIETNKGHSPFSFRKCIFVCSRGQYSDQQWLMLLQHEQQHYYMHHMADLLLMQFARIFLWFHPLVYLYQRRLQLLHEYEVDSRTTYDTSEYGRFLLEQALLKPAPALTHTLNYKPLKNRIMMMTKKASSRKMKLKLLLLLPLNACFIMCCSQKNALPVEITENEIYLKGNDVAYRKAITDTIEVEDVHTGERTVKYIVQEPNGPDSLNHVPIERISALKEAPTLIFPGNKKLTMDQLISEPEIKQLFCKLPDGKYLYGLNVVANENGKIVYLCDGGGPMIPGQFSNSGGVPLYPGSDSRILPVMSGEDRVILAKKLAALLMGPEIAYSTPQLPSGKKVPFLPDTDQFYSVFEIKDHKLTLTKQN